MSVRTPRRPTPRTALALAALAALALGAAAYGFHETRTLGAGFGRLDTPPAAIGAGRYLVGQDIAPGRYFTPGPNRSAPVPHCYWETTETPVAPLDEIEANSYASGPDFARLHDGQWVTFSGDCTWARRSSN